MSGRPLSSRLGCPRCSGPVMEDVYGATVRGGYVCVSETCPTYAIMKREVLHVEE